MSYDSTLLVTRFMLGATRLYARQPAAAIAPLEAAVRIDPIAFSALGLLGYAYGAARQLDGAVARGRASNRCAPARAPTWRSRASRSRSATRPRR